jgi:hypothetical protein
MSEGSIRTAVYRQRFDPGDLRSVCTFWKRQEAKNQKADPSQTKLPFSGTGQAA